MNDYKEKLASFIDQFSSIKSEVEIINEYINFIRKNSEGEYLEYPVKRFRKLNTRKGNQRELRNLKFNLLIYLFQYIEYSWYKDYTIFKNLEDVLLDDSIYKLKVLQKKYHLLFQYRPLKKGLLSRPQNGLRKRIDFIRKNPAGNTIGMQTVYSRVEIMALINEINFKISESYFKEINLQVNSILRTLENQQQLIDIGYNATLFSSHCIGYAVDIERKWYALNNKKLFSIIKNCLDEYHQRNIINLIDEGIVWHLCLNPAFINEYQQKANSWLLNKN